MKTWLRRCWWLNLCAIAWAMPCAFLVMTAQELVGFSNTMRAFFAVLLLLPGISLMNYFNRRLKDADQQAGGP